ncbi:TPA: M60 family metallopeptidase, partial [Clostridium perfringens]
GGMIYIDIDDSVPSGLRFEVDVKGVVDTPYYDLGRTTDEEWKKSKNAPGLFAEIRTPYLRFMVPSKFIRNINNPYNAALFWTNTAALSSNVMEQQYRVKPMSLVFDQYITAGIAYASVGAWICNLPPDWATSALDYDNIMKSGEWGTIHEINHHFQKRYNNYSDEWGVGNEFSEITNNALSSVSYILYTNIAAYRGEEGTYDWNKVADPYSSLKQQIYEGKQYYPNKPNIGNFMYSTFAHEIGPINFINVIKSTYDGGTFNGVYIPPYDYKLESDGEKSRNDRYDDLAYRLCVASERDYTWYIQNEL